MPMKVSVWKPMHRREDAFIGTPKEYYTRRCLPYGVWTCASGRVVYYNRDYHPIWESDRDGSPIRPANPDEWVTDILSQFWFYYDACPPWRSRVIEQFLVHKLVQLHVLERARDSRYLGGDRDPAIDWRKPPSELLLPFRRPSDGGKGAGVVGQSGQSPESLREASKQRVADRGGDTAT
jgi:hypothetical protein